MITCNLMASDGKPSRNAIVAAQSELVERLRRKWPLLDPATDCWACREDFDIERAHVRARSRGGSMRPSNFFLLCHRCHKNQPDCASAKDQVEWLLNQEPYSVGLARWVGKVVADARRMCRDESEFNEWCDYFDKSKMVAVFDKAAFARCHLDTFRANVAAAFRAELRAWLMQRRKP